MKPSGQCVVCRCTLAHHRRVGDKWRCSWCNRGCLDVRDCARCTRWMTEDECHTDPVTGEDVCPDCCPTCTEVAS